MNGQNNTSDQPDFQYRGARASVALHEEELRKFLVVWKRARKSGVLLPVVDDPDYVSWEALLGHVVRWAGTYLVWIRDQLDLSGPPIPPVPALEKIEAQSESYIEQVLEAWKAPLRDVPPERFIREVYTAPWGIPCCIDAMLEHAVMHPIKHRFQLEEWLGLRNISP